MASDPLLVRNWMCPRPACNLNRRLPAAWARSTWPDTTGTVPRQDQRVIICTTAALPESISARLVASPSKESLLRAG
jgi:hypothetical protein